MSRDVIIQIRLPRWSARRWLVVTAIALAIGAGTVYAKVVWTPFGAGAKLTSKQLNDNFTAMADAIDAINAMMPAAVQQPHLVVDQGKVDLGIYIGEKSTFGGGFGYSVVFAYNTKLKAPLCVFQNMDTILYDGANCTGTPFWGGGASMFASFSNTVVNSDLGTLVQMGGALQQQVAVRSQRTKGVCTNVNPYFGNNMQPIIDTKVPNLPAGGEVSIQMM